MRWDRNRKTPDVIDRRGASPRGGSSFGPGGGGGGLIGALLPLLLRGKVGGPLGILLIVGIVLFFVLSGGGGGFGSVTGTGGLGDSVQAPGFGDAAKGIPASQDPERDLRDFSAYVFTDAQETWERTLRDAGKPYNRAKLVLFRRGVDTGGCGFAPSSVGPFYCPADQRVYIDLSFFSDMQKQLGASGDFAWAYVIAHEVGHHVQRQLGTSSEVDRARQEDPGSANALSVRLELQADCYAGVWASTVFEDLEAGDVEEAMGAAEAVGDDRLQRRSGGGVDPDSFTHGTSAQRVKWFETGREGARPAACDTFSPDSP